VLTPQEVGILAGLVLLAQGLLEVVKKLIPRNGNVPKPTNGSRPKNSGDLSPEEWMGRMRQLLEENNRKLIELMAFRDERVREIFRQEISRRPR